MEAAALLMDIIRRSTTNGRLDWRCNATGVSCATAMTHSSNLIYGDWTSPRHGGACNMKDDASAEK